MAEPYSDPVRKPMTEGELDRACADYGGLMGEAKFRLRALRHALDGRTALHKGLVREFGYLQLRMICELIALGCLIIHGDIPETKIKRRFDTHAADRILNNLEQLTPEFYPHPYFVDPNSAPGTRKLVFRPENEYLTKAQLLTLYRTKCGDALHVGRLDKLLAQPRSDDVSEMAAYAALVLNLLHTHFVLFAQDSKGVFCEFRDMNDPRLVVTLASV